MGIADLIRRLVTMSPEEVANLLKLINLIKDLFGSQAVVGEPALGDIIRILLELDAEQIENLINLITALIEIFSAEQG